MSHIRKPRQKSQTGQHVRSSRSGSGTGNESGVALITALLIVALVTVTVVAMTSRQQLDIRRTGNMLQSDQAYVLTLSGEAFAKGVLKKDPDKTDNKEDDWALVGVSFPFKGGLLTVTLDELHNRFNLNNLIDDQGVASQHDIARLEHLIDVIKGKDETPDEFKQVNSKDLVEAIVDWVDKDKNVRPGGAEDSDYLDLERPYRTANQPMASISELLLVKGMKPEYYKLLLPYVVALPARTKINVNTLKPELIQALFEDTTCPKLGKINIRQQGKSAQDLIENKSADETVYDKFSTLDDFMKHTAFAGCVFEGIIANGQNNNQQNNQQNNTNLQNSEDVMDVKSEYFLLDAEAVVGPDDHLTRKKLYSLLERKNGKVSTLMRAQGTY